MAWLEIKIVCGFQNIWRHNMNWANINFRMDIETPISNRSILQKIIILNSSKKLLRHYKSNVWIDLNLIENAFSAYK